MQHLVSDRSVVWTSIFGGSAEDAAESVDLDANGNLVIAGYTASSDFSYTNLARQLVTLNHIGKKDALLLNVDKNGHLLAAFVEGSSEDDAYTNVVALNSTDLTDLSRSAAGEFRKRKTNAAKYWF